MLAAIDFHGGTGTETLLEALEILRGLNAKGARKVPDAALADFVPARWK